MHGNRVIVSTDPKGNRKVGILDGAYKPGTLLKIKAATEPKSGHFTFVPSGADPGIVAILLKNGRGGTVDDAYAAGDYADIYFPQQGEELNIRYTGAAGAFAIGDEFMPDANGKLIDSAGGVRVAIGLETVADTTEEALVHSQVI